MKNTSGLGIVLTLISVFLWGTAGTAQSLTGGATSPLWIGALRLVTACVIFYILYFYTKCRTKKTVSSHNEKTYKRDGSYWRLIALSGLCMGLYNLTFFKGVSMTGVAIGTITTIGSAPIWAGILQVISTKKAPARLWWVGALCATMGGVWMVLAQNSAWHINPIGLIVSLCAGFCYALYSLTSKRLVKMATPLTITTHTFTVAAFIAIPAAYLLAGLPTLTATSWAVILYLAIFTTAIAYLLYTRALKYISAATAVALTLFEPITAFVLAILVAKEAVNPLSIIGLALILAGLSAVLKSELHQKVK